MGFVSIPVAYYCWVWYEGDCGDAVCCSVVVSRYGKVDRWPEVFVSLKRIFVEFCYVREGGGRIVASLTGLDFHRLGSQTLNISTAWRREMLEK